MLYIAKITIIYIFYFQILKIEIYFYLKYLFQNYSNSHENKYISQYKFSHGIIIIIFINF